MLSKFQNFNFLLDHRDNLIQILTVYSILSHLHFECFLFMLDMSLSKNIMLCNFEILNIYYIKSCYLTESMRKKKVKQNIFNEKCCKLLGFQEV